MAKRLSEKQKEEIIKFFKSGRTIDELSRQFNCSKLTVSRNLKKILGENIFKELIDKNKSKDKILNKKSKNDSSINNLNDKNDNNNFVSRGGDNYEYQEEYFSSLQFTEITPLEFEIDNSPQKDLSSLPISDVKFPKIVYMVVHKNIELEVKYLKEYADWQFLSQEELNRKTIEIYEDIKNAKRFCNKEQKVIKVPNTNVFKIVAPLLISRGISRIIISDRLIAL